jgi:hypothetical protein
VVESDGKECFRVLQQHEYLSQRRSTMGKWYRAVAISALFAVVCFNHSMAQQNGPKGVLVSNCLSVSAANGAYHFTNKCSYMIEVAAAQPYPNGQPNGSDAFELHYWACATPSVPISSSTHASPRSNANDVICPTRGTAGAAY